MWDQTFGKCKNRTPVRQPSSFLLGPLLRAAAGLGEGEEAGGDKDKEAGRFENCRSLGDAQRKRALNSAAF